MSAPSDLDRLDQMLSKLEKPLRFFETRLTDEEQLYGLDNAGTVYDGGGNVSNNKTGAGSIIVPTL